MLMLRGWRQGPLLFTRNHHLSLEIVWLPPLCPGVPPIVDTKPPTLEPWLLMPRMELIGAEATMEAMAPPSAASRERVANASTPLARSTPRNERRRTA